MEDTIFAKSSKAPLLLLKEKEPEDEVEQQIASCLAMNEDQCGRYTVCKKFQCTAPSPGKEKEKEDEVIINQ